MPCKRSFLPLIFLFLGVHTAQAAFVGDLVYCDVNNDGLFNVGDGDFGLDDVEVTMTCTDVNGAACFVGTTTTGPEVLNTPDIGLLGTLCADAPLTWDPNGDVTGRYLFEIAQECVRSVRPAACTLTVTGGLSPTCDVLGTPRVTEMGNMPARPVDNNNDGDFCDAVDGPFPEGQPLGNTLDYGGCEARPDPAPGDNLYTVIIGPSRDECSIYNDFGFKPPAPSIDIEKATNGVDADDPNAGDAPQVEPGDPVFWTYVVTNTGPVTLFNISVNDDQGVAVSCPTDTLAPGGMMTCTATGTAEELFSTGFTTVPGACGNIPDRPLYENMGRATGESAQGEFVEDEDASHYCNPPGPDIDIEKATNGVDADDPNAGDAPQFAPGDAVTWTYVVTNTGDVPLENVTVVDDQGVLVSCPQTTLAVDEVITCTASGFAEDLDNTGFTTVPGLCGGRPQRPLYENMGMATGQTVAGDFVDDVDPSHYCNPPECGLTVLKGCEIPPPPPPPAGKCDGKLQQFTMIWAGADGTEISLPEKDGPTSYAPNGTVNSGDEITFFGPFESNDVVVEVVGLGTSKFHVSCSDKDMDGDTLSNEDQQQVSEFGRDCGKFQGDRGDSEVNQWLLEGFIDKNGKVLDCTVPTSDTIIATECEIFAAPVNCDTAGKPSVITMRYTGGACPGNNTQEGKSNCSGSINGTLPVTVTLDGGTLGPIGLGQTFDVPTTGSNTVISLTNGGGTQTNNVHTSCSAPLNAGETFGGMELVALDGQGLGSDVIYSYLISNNGAETITNITAIDDKLGPVPGTPLALLGVGESKMLTAATFVSDTVTNTVTVAGSVTSGAQCLDSASATVTAMGPPPCDVSVLLEKVEDKKIKWKLTNNSSSRTATIESLTVGWPGDESLKKIEFDGNDILKDDLRSAPSTTVVESEWQKEVKDRRLDIGDSGKKLEIEFEDKFPLEKEQPASDFSLTVTFSEGCSVTF